MRAVSAGPIRTVTAFLFHGSTLQKQATKSSPYSRGREPISPSQRGGIHTDYLEFSYREDVSHISLLSHWFVSA